MAINSDRLRGLSVHRPTTRRYTSALRGQGGGHLRRWWEDRCCGSGIPESIPEDEPGREAIADAINAGTLPGRAATLADVGNVTAFAVSDLAGKITAASINMSVGTLFDQRGRANVEFGVTRAVVLRGSTRRRSVTLIAVLGVLLALNACGSSSSSSGSASSGSAAGTSSTNQISHTKTKFAFHAALAFGAFHHWIYKPAKAGELTHPLSHKVAFVKAGLAAAFVYHEVKLALKDAQADPTLSKLVAPLTSLQDKVKGLAGQVKSGGADTGSLAGTNDAIASIKQQSASAGQPIQEQVPSSPSG